MTFYNEKLNGARTRYPTYDIEFCTIVQALMHCDITRFSESLSWTSIMKLSIGHAKWVAFLHEYTFRHKVGKHNKAVGALSRKMTLLVTVRVNVVGFDLLLEMYVNGIDCGQT